MESAWKAVFVGLLRQAGEKAGLYAPFGQSSSAALRVRPGAGDWKEPDKCTGRGSRLLPYARLPSLHPPPPRRPPLATISRRTPASASSTATRIPARISSRTSAPAIRPQVGSPRRWMGSWSRSRSGWAPSRPRSPSGLSGPPVRPVSTPGQAPARPLIRRRTRPPHMQLACRPRSVIAWGSTAATAARTASSTAFRPPRDRTAIGIR